MSKLDSVLITGGGTGGHIYPAVALVEEMTKTWPDTKVQFVGELLGMENEIVSRAGIPFCGISCRRIRRKFSLENLLVLPTLIKGIFQSLKIMKKFNPNIVIGMGGFVSAPVILAALLQKRRVILHEQNSVAGMTNRWLAGYVSMVITTFQSAHSALSNPNILPAGIPLRREALSISYDADFQALGLEEDKFTVLIFGGSQGSKKICEIAVETFEKMEKENGSTSIWFQNNQKENRTNQTH